jgi:cell shape-determining protein MreD
MTVRLPYIITAYIAAFFLQTTLFSSLPLLPVSVNLVLCAMVVLHCYSSRPAIYAGAVCCGLLIDLSLGYFIGVAAFAYMAVAIGMVLTANLVYKNHFFTATYTALWATVVYELVYWGILLLYGVHYSLLHMLAGLPAAMLLNGLVSGVLKWVKG